jgi:hypothetical protein
MLIFFKCRDRETTKEITQQNDVVEQSLITFPAVTSGATVSNLGGYFGFEASFPEEKLSEKLHYSQ